MAGLRVPSLRVPRMCVGGCVMTYVSMAPGMAVSGVPQVPGVGSNEPQDRKEQGRDRAGDQAGDEDFMQPEPISSAAVLASRGPNLAHAVHNVKR